MMPIRHARKMLFAVMDTPYSAKVPTNMIDIKRLDKNVVSKNRLI